MVDEVIAAVREAVPVYRGGLDPTVREGVHVALGAFLTQISGGDAGLPGRDVYVRFGRAERRNGRSLEALLAAYRAGAQRAWRVFAEEGDRAGVDARDMYALAEGIFAFIDEISAASAEGHAFEESLVARELAEHRRRLLEAVLSDPQPPREELAPLVDAAEWELPERLAVLAYEPGPESERLPPEVVTGDVRGRSWALVGDPDAPGLRAEIERGLRGGSGGLGPGVAPPRAAESARRAELALTLAGPGELIVADERPVDMVLRIDASLATDLADRALAPLDELPDTQRARLMETLRAWLDAHGEARPAADQLHVHVQTVRYRLDRLRELMGDAALDDPERRLELALALRVREGG